MTLLIGLRSYILKFSLTVFLWRTHIAIKNTAVLNQRRRIYMSNWDGQWRL